MVNSVSTPVVGTVFLTSLLVGLALQPLLIPWLRRRGVMDVPNERSSHIAITPRGGGIAVLAAIGAALLVGHHGGRDAAVVYLGALILGGVGLTDDFLGLSAKVRLGVLLLVGSLAGLLLGSLLPLILAVPVMAVWTAAYVNAFNFMDGINGISGLTAVVAGVAYTLMGLEFDSRAAVVIGVALAGAAVSFLPYNVPRAKVFLGDVGSYSLGFTIAALSWIVWAAGAPLAMALAPTAVYLADTGVTLVRRYRRGAPLTEAHREHTYQVLTLGGLSHSAVALAIAGVQTLVVAVLWWGYGAGTPWLGVLAALAALAAYSAAPRLREAHTAA